MPVVKSRTRHSRRIRLPSGVSFHSGTDASNDFTCSAVKALAPVSQDTQCFCVSSLVVVMAFSSWETGAFGQDRRRKVIVAQWPEISKASRFASACAGFADFARPPGSGDQ